MEYLALILPQLVKMLMSGIKLYIIPAVGRQKPWIQRIIVGVLSAVGAALFVKFGIVVPEAGLFSPEALTLLLYGALGAIGLHSMTSEKEKE